MFVTLDGPNGVGKSAVARRLAERLTGSGASVLQTREPSESSAGRLALDAEARLHGWPLAVLVVADRYLHVWSEIAPALASGTAVVCDRYVASTLVLQRLDGMDRQILRDMNAEAMKPDLAVVLLADPQLLGQRLAARSRLSRFERMQDVSRLEDRLYIEAADDLTLLGHSTMTLDCSSLSIDEVAGGIQRRLTSGDASSRQ
jgi:dTMP kinase